MKKAFITLCVIAMTTMSVFAASGNEKPRYYTPRWTQGWFIDLAGTYSIFASNGSAYHNMSTYYGGFNADPNIKQHQFGFSAKAGRRVSPSVAARIGYDRHKASNMNGKDFMYKDMYLDIMESPLDFFFGYNPKRIYTLWVYGGVGVVAWDKTTANRPYNLLIHWGNSNVELGFRGGLMNNFRLSNSLDFHIDATAVVTRWSLDTSTPGHYGNPNWHRGHFDFSGMVGLMWYLGGRTLDVATTEEIVSGDCSKQEARINELIDQVNGLQDELDDCRKNGTTVHDTVYVTRQGEVISYPFSVFFNKGSYELRDGRDRINLQEIAQAAINHNLVVNLRGTCDAATASAAFNKTLAENRCNKIKNELVKIGVPADNIVINAVGGVSELKPAEYDRRVFITFSEK
jgi:outer membrane protein OmpA-like peptidoglycan-associated protein